MDTFDTLYIAKGNAPSEKALQLMTMLEELPKRLRVIDVLKQKQMVPPYLKGVPTYVCTRLRSTHVGSAAFEAMIDEDTWLGDRGGEMEEQGPRGLEYIKNSNLYDRGFVSGMKRSNLDSGLSLIHI